MKAKILRALFWGGLLPSSALVANEAFALCTNGRHPDVVAELKASEMVVTAIVVSGRDESSSEDPQGVEDTIYTVRVLEVFKGKPDRLVRITSENTSSRFPMDIGKKYLLFITRDGQTRFIDACGRSGSVAERAAEIQALKKVGKS
jgi:hypothetical protein